MKLTPSGRMTGIGLVVLVLAGTSCGSGVTKPSRTTASLPAHPHLLAVTAPDRAVAGSIILVRVHWATWDCGVEFVGFDVHVDSAGTHVIEPRWRRPDDDYGCPAGAADIGREETILLQMPSRGPMRLRVAAGERSVIRTIDSGAPPAVPAWTIEAVELGTGRRVPGAPITFFEATPTSSHPDFIAMGDTILVAETDSTGFLRVAGFDTPALGRLFAFTAEHPVTRDRYAVPLVAIPPASQVAERMTLILDGHTDSGVVRRAHALLSGRAGRSRRREATSPPGLCARTRARMTCGRARPSA